VQGGRKGWTFVRKLPAEFGSLVRAIDSTPSSLGRVVKLGVNFVAGATAAAPFGAASLDHEALDNTVETAVVIEAALRQSDHVANMPRGFLGVKCQPNPGAG
jgi:nucleoside-diphosphate-sugar epimerase